MSKPEKSKENEKEKVLTSEEQIAAFLKANKEDHFNFLNEKDYKVSSGSLKLDQKMNGGLVPGVHRFIGSRESGKTSSSLLFAKHFQDTVPNSKVVYIKAEGRFSEEMQLRSGLDFSPEKFFCFKCNIYESVFALIADLVRNNPTRKKYMFIVDSVDALCLKDDMNKPWTELDKVAGGPLITSVFLKKMSLQMGEEGHIVILIAQNRAIIRLANQPLTQRHGDSSGGNAVQHYANWTLEFETIYKKHWIFPGGDDKASPVGRNCSVEFIKTPNEKSGEVVTYPIKYGQTGGNSVWREREAAELLLAWEHLRRASKGVEVLDTSLTKEIRAKFPEFPESFKGVEDMYSYFSNKKPEIGQYVWARFKDIIQ